MENYRWLSICPSVMTGSYSTLKFRSDLKSLEETSEEGQNLKIHILDSKPRTDDEDNLPVILLSGISVAWYEWQDVVGLVNSCSRVIVYDRPGQGISEIPSSDHPGTLYAQIDLLLQVMKEKNISQAHLVGHSMGGFIAEGAARLFPQHFPKVTLLDGSFEEYKVPRPAAIKKIHKMVAKKTVLEKLVTHPKVFSGTRLVYGEGNYWLKKRQMRTIWPSDLAIAAAFVFLDSSRFIGCLREMRAYKLWAAELACLAKNHPLKTQVFLVAAWDTRPNRGRGHVKYLKKQAQTLAQCNPLAEVRFIRIAGSHMLMHSHPWVLATHLVKNY